MDYSRIRSAMDVERTQKAHVVVVGVGGSANLVKNLVRCGVARLTLLDPDRIEPSNLARQDHGHDQLNLPKVEALARLCKGINPQVEVRPVARDFTSLKDAEIDELAGDSDLIILATDRFKAQARGNEVALRLGTPAVWIGLYPRGLGGEVAFWHPQLNACYRCLMSARYKAHDEARSNGKLLDPPSDGATVFDVDLVDAIAGQIAIGLLTMGVANRFGQLIAALGDRNFIQVKIDQGYASQGRDLVRERLGITDENEAYFGWNTIVLRDPTAHLEACPDCKRFRGDTIEAGRRVAGAGGVRLWPEKNERKKPAPTAPKK